MKPFKAIAFEEKLLQVNPSQRSAQLQAMLAQLQQMKDDPAFQTAVAQQPQHLQQPCGGIQGAEGDAMEIDGVSNGKVGAQGIGEGIGMDDSMDITPEELVQQMMNPDATTSGQDVTDMLEFLLKAGLEKAQKGGGLTGCGGGYSGGVSGGAPASTQQASAQQPTSGREFDANGFDTGKWDAGGYGFDTGAYDPAKYGGSGGAGAGSGVGGSAGVGAAATVGAATASNANVPTQAPVQDDFEDEGIDMSYDAEVGGGEGEGKVETQPEVTTQSTSTVDSASSSDEYGGLSGDAQTEANTPEQTADLQQKWMANLQRDFGLTKAQAAGIVANLTHESAGMNSGINQGGAIGQPSGNMADDNANGYGMAQWGGVRKEALLKYADDHGLDRSSQAAAYGYLKQELKGEYAGVIDSLKGTNDAASATESFCSNFEKPSDPQLASRMTITNALMA